MLVSLPSHNTVTENMGNYTVSAHSQLHFQQSFCFLAYEYMYRLQLTVQVIEKMSVIKIWTHEKRRIYSALCYRWVKDTEAAFLSNMPMLYVLVQTIILNHAAWLTLHTLFFFFLLPFKSTVKWYFTQVHKYYFMDINLKSFFFNIYLWFI